MEEQTIEIRTYRKHFNSKPELSDKKRPEMEAQMGPYIERHKGEYEGSLEYLERYVSICHMYGFNTSIINLDPNHKD